MIKLVCWWRLGGWRGWFPTHRPECWALSAEKRHGASWSSPPVWKRFICSSGAVDLSIQHIRYPILVNCPILKIWITSGSMLRLNLGEGKKKEKPGQTSRNHKLLAWKRPTGGVTYEAGCHIKTIYWVLGYSCSTEYQGIDFFFKSLIPRPNPKLANRQCFYTELHPPSP